MLRSVWQDLRFALRSYRRTPGVATLAVVTLALGIGANTAVFSVVDGVLLKPLPYPQPDRVGLLFFDNPKKGVRHGVTSRENYQDWRARNTSFENLATFMAVSDTIRVQDGDPEQLSWALVSPRLFATLGVSPLVGRDFAPDEGAPGHDVVMIGYDLWRTRFGRDPNVVGRQVRFGGQAYTLIGVMPKRFAFPDGAKFWFASNSEGHSAKSYRGNVAYSVVGRLKPGVTWADAKAEMAAIGERLAREYPVENEGTSVSVEPIADEVAAPVRQPLRILWAAVALVLLIACANVANLLLTRGAARRREFAVRIAIGAGRWRVVRQLLVESAVLGVAGGALGLGLAYWCLRALLAASPTFLPRLDAIGVDGDVLAFSVVATAATVFLFGLAPALLVSHVDPQEALRSSNRATSDRSGNRFRRALAAAEIALSLVLLIVAGLALRSLYRLQTFDYGLVVDRLAVVGLAPPEEKKANGGEQYFREINERIAAVPGVSGVVETSSVMLEQRYKQSMSVQFEIDGRPPEAQPKNVQMQLDVVSPGYFHVAGIPVLAGAEFDETDSQESATPSMLINETFARAYWPGEDPVGKRFRPSDPNFPNPWWTIKGVVADTVREGPGGPTNLEAYMAGFNGWGDVVVRTEGDPATILGPVRDAIREVDAGRYVPPVRTLADVLGEDLAERRLVTRLLALFAAVAVAIAAVGVFGVMSYLVSQRTNEIGVRVALGAMPEDIVRRVLAESLAVTAVGLVVGIAFAAGASKAIESMLFGVGPLDPAVYVALTLGLAAVAAAASYLPARAAARVDAMDALRSE